MNMLDLFSGIGGFRLAAQRVFGESLDCKCMVEIDPFCQKVLMKNWPGVKIHGDIKTFKGGGWGSIDLLTGGFPCQPFSVVGKQGGKGDDRYLWPEMLRVIKEARPRWVVGENVTGIINMELDNVLSDLEGEGYETQTFIIPACGTDAKHKRYRVWVVANSVRCRLQKDESLLNRGKGNVQLYKKGAPCDISGDLPIKWDGSEGNCNDLRKGHGIPHGVDRLKSLGNAIVPQVAQRIFWGVRCVDEALAI